MTLPESAPPEGASYEFPRRTPTGCFDVLQTPVQYLRGVGPHRASQLRGLGIATVEDLLYHLPFRYEDRRELRSICEATVGEDSSFTGRLVRLERRIARGRRLLVLGTLADSTGWLTLVWFHPKPYVVDRLKQGTEFIVHGKVEAGRGLEKKIVHPEFEPLEPEKEQEREAILPVYVKPTGMPLRSIRGWIRQALSSCSDSLPSFLPRSIAQRQGLLDLKKALEQIHLPGRDSHLEALNTGASVAHRSIIFDEFFYLQLGLALQRKQRVRSPGISLGGKLGELTRRMKTLLPFSLTAAQDRVLVEIHADMASPRPMQRLLQGDVGSGKTMVAWLAALRAIENGFQSVLIAPTELLAEQHFQQLSPFAQRLGVSMTLLIGSLSARGKKEVREQIAGGAVAFVVGTHALIQEEVQVPRLGLGIVDEQHRFGVVQRMAIRRLTISPRGTADYCEPDLLLMSATPIPRSLAMVLYGDMEISYLDEMPPGRIPIRTRLLREREQSRVHEIVSQELHQGRQAYIVYPLVDESERLPLPAATRMVDELRGIFREFRVGLIHGKMPSSEREAVMRRFKEGFFQILVATTVIEVGVDVPRATVMVVQNAERFGLSQLHQLRGRVGRGGDPSQCLLVYGRGCSAEALQRLKVMAELRDGFRIAEADLRLRGPGELMGTRQSGLPDFRLANLARDSKLLWEARREALAWLTTNPTLTDHESLALREVLAHRWGGKLQLAAIG